MVYNTNHGTTYSTIELFAATRTAVIIVGTFAIATASVSCRVLASLKLQIRHQFEALRLRRAAAIQSSHSGSRWWCMAA